MGTISEKVTQNTYFVFNKYFRKFCEAKEAADDNITDAERCALHAG